MNLLKALIKTLLKISLTILLAGVCSFLIATTAASHFIVSNLAKVPQDEKVDANLKALTEIAEKYSSELNQFDELKKELHKTKWPSLCANICKPSSFDNDSYSQDRAKYLRDFYHAQKSQALQDPQFRLKLEQTDFLSKAFFPEVREFLTESQKATAEAHPWKLTFRLETLILKNLFEGKKHWDELKNDSHKLDSLRSFMKSCNGSDTSTGSNKAARQALLLECQKVYVN